MVPREVIEEYGDMSDWRNLVGTGPFMVTDVVDGSSATLVKNPDYWGYDEKYPENRLPYVDEFRGLIMPEEATRIAALRTRKLDYIIGGWAGYIINIDTRDSLQKTNPEILQYPFPYRSTVSMSPNPSHPILGDLEVRKALQMAINQQEIAAVYYKGYVDTTPYGILGAEGWHTPFAEWPEELKKEYTYNPEEAERILDEAGYPRGADGIRFKTEILAEVSWEDVNYYELVAGYWSRIGVDLQIVPSPWGDRGERWESGDWGFQLQVAALKGTFDLNLLTSYTSTSLERVAHMRRNDPDYDRIIDSMMTATTAEEYMSQAKAADDYVLNQHWIIWGREAPWTNVAQPWVTGWNGEVQVVTDQWNELAARLWIDSELKEAMGGR